MFGLVICTSPLSLPPSWECEQTYALSIVWYSANTEAKLYIHDTRLKRQTLKMALGKFNISIVSADSNTIKQTAISPHWRPCLNWWFTLHSPAFYVKPDRHARSTNKQQKEGIRFTSGAASKWSLNGGAGFWLYGAESRCICRLAACSDTQKLQGPLSVTGPSPANGSHSHLSAGWQRWRIHRSECFALFYYRLCASAVYQLRAGGGEVCSPCH